MKNPLLTSFILPPFSSINSDNIVPAIKKILKNCKLNVENIVINEKKFNWDNLCQSFLEQDDLLNRIWSIVEHLNLVKNSKELRESYEKCLPLLSKYNTWIYHNKDLHNAYLNLRQSNYYFKLNTPQKTYINNTLRDFELSGINISKNKKKRYGQIVTILSKLSSTYNNNVLDSSMNWNKLITNIQELSGLPQHILDITNYQAKSKKKEGWLLTLDLPIYLSILNYCDNQNLRKEIFYAYKTRASDQSPNFSGKWDNGPIINEIMKLRYEMASLLNFKTYADKAMITKMIKTPKQVIDFLTNLIKKIKVHGTKELETLSIFAKKNYGCNSIKLWDFAYYSEKQKQCLFSINDETLRPYFPDFKVISGFFEIIKRIYSIYAKERYDLDTWYPKKVRFFDLCDKNGKLLGSFYMDLYIRDNKHGGAWMQDCVSMLRKSDGTLQRPVAYLTCNFTPSINEKYALLNHNEVVTFFHEAGHVLHHILTRIEVSGVTGIHGVPLDAIEFPSQFMENFCWHSESLKFISGHYETGESLPTTVLNKLIKMKNYQIALFLLRQLEFGLFDFRIHYELSSKKDIGIQIYEILKSVKKQINIFPMEIWDRSINSFNHIFSGSYAAGYYSYLWSNVLAADAWSLFEEKGIFNSNTGESFLNEILSKGGSEDPMILFTRFRGRKPNLEAMLHQYSINDKFN